MYARASEKKKGAGAECEAPIKRNTAALDARRENTCARSALKRALEKYLLIRDADSAEAARGIR